MEVHRAPKKNVSLIGSYAIAAIIGVAAVMYMIRRPVTEGNATQLLADGTEVVLHKNATIQWMGITETQREVAVNGKAYFKVAHDEQRPFIVRLNGAIISVEGTSFMVDSRRDYADVYVESGTVGFTKSSDTGISVKLATGEMGMIKTGNKGILKKEIDDANYLSWKTKKLIFEETGMMEVKQLLEDVYELQISFEAPGFKKCKLSAKFNDKSPEQVIETIARIFDVDYSMKNKKAIFKGRGC